MVDLTAKHVVGAHYGLRDWLVQRITAVVMVVWVVTFLGALLYYGGFDHVSWRALWATPGFRLLSFAFMVSMLWHAWIGVRNIAMDYIKPTWLRLTFQSAVATALVLYLGWTIQVLWAVGR